jgi:hypothetical protein
MSVLKELPVNESSKALLFRELSLTSDRDLVVIRDEFALTKCKYCNSVRVIPFLHATLGQLADRIANFAATALSFLT